MEALAKPTKPGRRYDRKFDVSRPVTRDARSLWRTIIPQPQPTPMTATTFPGNRIKNLQSAKGERRRTMSEIKPSTTISDLSNNASWTVLTIFLNSLYFTFTMTYSTFGNWQSTTHISNSFNRCSICVSRFRSRSYYSCTWRNWATVCCGLFLWLAF